MTVLKRKVRREAAASVEKGRAIIVTLEPSGSGDLISFRLKGTRTAYTVSVHSCFMHAATQYVIKQRMERLRLRQARRRKGARS